jgi:hypothetical protein
MARKKFGNKKTSIDPNIFSYNFYLQGEKGIGKTTVMVELAKLLLNDDEYIHLNLGKEDGNKALIDTISENVASYEDWQYWRHDTDEQITKEEYEKLEKDGVDVSYEDYGLGAFYKEIIKNKSNDYKNLKLLLLDTSDELFDFMEPQIIKEYNKAVKKGKRGANAKLADTINEAEGGFQKGQDAVIDRILDMIWNLKKVGVACWFIGHVKVRNVTDLITQAEYREVTTNLTHKYYDAIANKMDFVGTAHYDRSIKIVKTGKKNIVTKKEETKGVVENVDRVITFRDNTNTIDCKSRFDTIVEKIPLDAESLKDALNDAILDKFNQQSGNKNTEEEKKKIKAKKEKKQEADLNKVKSQVEKELKDDLKKDLINRYKQHMTPLDKEGRIEVVKKAKSLGLNVKELNNADIGDLEKFIGEIGA